jgi:hypothetical protein
MRVSNGITNGEKTKIRVNYKRFLEKYGLLFAFILLCIIISILTPS